MAEESGKKERNLQFWPKVKKQIDNLPEEVSEVINTNLQALKQSRATGFSTLTGWSNQGKVTDKKLSGTRVRQLSIKDKQSWRMIYVAEYENDIAILHVFKKQKDGVQTSDIETAKQRLKVADSLYLK